MEKQLYFYKCTTLLVLKNIAVVEDLSICSLLMFKKVFSIQTSRHEQEDTLSTVSCRETERHISVFFIETFSFLAFILVRYKQICCLQQKSLGGRITSFLKILIQEITLLTYVLTAMTAVSQTLMNTRVNKKAYQNYVKGLIKDATCLSSFQPDSRLSKSGDYFNSRMLPDQKLAALFRSIMVKFLL